MIRRLKTWGTWVSMVCLAGCQLGSQGIPQDPLFIGRKPIEAKAEFTPPVAVTYAEPAIPVDTVAIARSKQNKNVPGILTTRPGMPGIGIPKE